MKIFRPIYLAIGVLVLAWLLSRYLYLLPGQLFHFLDYLPYILGVVGIGLALSFQRSRMAQLILVVLFLYWLLVHFVHARWYVGLIESLAVLLPLNVLLFAIYRERGLLSLSSVFRLAVLLLQAGLVAWFLARHPHAVVALLHKYWWPTWSLPRSHFGQLSQLVGIVSLLVSLGLAVRSRSWQEGAVFTTLVLMVTVLHFDTGANMNIMLFAMVPLAIVLAILLDSYRMAYLDELTGLPGRRALSEAMDKLGGLYTLAMLDVDHFKKFNDTYGHDVGDQVLKFIAGKMRKVGGGGRAYRYGGEEFTFLFPGKGLEAAIPHLERVRKDIADSEFALRGKDRPDDLKEGSRKRKKQTANSVKITASFGVAEQGGSLLPDEVLKQADDALYRAKSGGRNRVSQ